MAKKGGKKGLGSVYFRKDRRRWVAELDLGVDEAGERQVWRWYSPDESPESYAEAKNQLAQAVYERSRGMPLVVDRQTLADYLDYWLENQIKPNRTDSTHGGYETTIRLHIKPAIGKVPLAQLSPQHILRLLNRQRESGLGARARELTYVVLHAALGKAVEWSLISRNPADGVEKPAAKARERRTLTPEQAIAFLRSIEGDRLRALYAVTMALGLRQGEALGVRWEDVDLDHLVLRSNVQLQRTDGKYELRAHKTVRSKRTLPLPPFVAEYLREHQARMEAERQAASEWGNEWNLVFVTETGAPINGTWLTHRFQHLLEQAGLPEIDYHGLRHTAGTFLAYLGVSAPAIRDMLGHTQLSTTDVYLHSIPREHVEAMRRMDGLLSGRKG